MKLHSASLLVTFSLAALQQSMAQTPPVYNPANPQYASGTKSCGKKNDPTPPVIPCPTCVETCPYTGADSSDQSGGASTSQSPPLGPSPFSGTAPPSGEVEIPKSMIIPDHGGALFHINDLKVGGALSGVPLEFTRYHNTRDTDSLGDLMGHGRTWSHSFSWRLTISGSTPRVTFPNGRRLDFTFSHNSTYLGQPAAVYFPPATYGERLINTGNFWYLIPVGASSHKFERVVAPDSTVLYHLRESKDTRGNILTYTTDSAARVTKAEDALVGCKS